MNSGHSRVDGKHGRSWETPGTSARDWGLEQDEATFSRWQSRLEPVVSDDQPPIRQPWVTEDYFELEAEVNDLLKSCGFAARPAGRIWLWRPPSTTGSLDATLESLTTAGSAAGCDPLASTSFATVVEHELARLFTSEDGEKPSGAAICSFDLGPS